MLHWTTVEISSSSLHIVNCMVPQYGDIYLVESVFDWWYLLPGIGIERFLSLKACYSKSSSIENAPHENHSGSIYSNHRAPQVYSLIPIRPFEISWLMTRINSLEFGLGNGWLETRAVAIPENIAGGPVFVVRI